MLNRYRRKRDTQLYTVTYKFINGQETYTTTATSAGLASILADWGIEVLEVATM